MKITTITDEEMDYYKSLARLKDKQLISYGIHSKKEREGLIKNYIRLCMLDTNKWNSEDIRVILFHITYEIYGLNI